MKRVTSLLFKKTRAREKGVAAVELAIIIPLFGVLLLGVMEIGGMARDHQILQNAAREGARFSAQKDNWIGGAANPAAVQTTIKNRVIAYLANERITVVAGNIAVNQAYVIPGPVNIMGSQIIVTYNRPLMFPGISRWLSPGTTLQGKAVFPNFY